MGDAFTTTEGIGLHRSRRANQPDDGSRGRRATDSSGPGGFVFAGVHLREDDLARSWSLGYSPTGRDGVDNEQAATAFGVSGRGRRTHGSGGVGVGDLDSHNAGRAVVGESQREVGVRNATVQHGIRGELSDHQGHRFGAPLPYGMPQVAGWYVARRRAWRAPLPVAAKHRVNTRAVAPTCISGKVIPQSSQLDRAENRDCASRAKSFR